MRRLRFLLRPGWIMLAVVVAAFAFMCFTVLAPWQLGKNASTGHRNELIEESMKSDPVPVWEFLGGGTDFTDGDEWRQVTVSGTYLADKQVLVRLRSVHDAPAYEVLTPLRTAEGPAILVNRGYVRPVDGSKPPEIPAPPSEPVTLAARIRVAGDTAPDKTGIQADGYSQVYTIDPAEVTRMTGVALTGGYLQLSDDQPGGLGTIDLPQRDAGPYLSYGLQWLAFGVMAPLGLAYFVRAELRERRARRELGTPDPVENPRPGADETAEAGSVGTPDTATPRTESGAAGLARTTAARPGSTTVATPQAQSAVREAKLADRYGKHR